MKFTIEEFRNYVKSQDSLGDVVFNLSEDNITKANEELENDDILPDEDEDEYVQDYDENQDYDGEINPFEELDRG